MRVLLSENIFTKRLSDVQFYAIDWAKFQFGKWYTVLLFPSFCFALFPNMWCQTLFLETAHFGSQTYMQVHGFCGHVQMNGCWWTTRAFISVIQKRNYLEKICKMSLECKKFEWLCILIGYTAIENLFFSEQ